MSVDGIRRGLKDNFDPRHSGDLQSPLKETLVATEVENLSADLQENHAAVDQKMSKMEQNTRKMEQWIFSLVAVGASLVLLVLAGGLYFAMKLTSGVDKKAGQSTSTRA